MDLSQRVAFNTFSQLLARLVVIFLTILTTGILTRVLGPTGYGHYVFITTAILFFASIADWGTAIITVREAVKDEKVLPRIFGSMVLVRLGTALLALLVLVAAIFVLASFRLIMAAALIASLTLLFLSLKTSFQMIFQSKLRLEIGAAIEVLGSLFFLLLVLLFFGLGRLGEVRAATELVMFSWVASTLICAACGFLISRRLVRIDFTLDLKIAKRILTEALPMGGLLVVFSLYNRLDIFVLNHFWGAAPVGIYGLAYKIHDNLVLPAAFLLNSFFPLFARSQKDLKSFYPRVFALLTLMIIPLAIFVFLAAPLIVSILAGQQFLPSVLALRVLLLATAIAFFNHLTGYTLVAIGQQRFSLLVALFALIFNLAANIIFVPRYSYLAAAVITIFTEGLVFLCGSLFLAKKMGLFPLLSAFPETISKIVRERRFF
ncbi:hypothetical protein FJZ40_00395 [Candidatus Shapirobacteria bacterium]|nr:hypothetical protein [Candidatus Shapirobacteria bacterium]